MVTIIDPHIKKDGEYHVSKQGAELDVYIKNKDGSTDFDGWCWPGSSTWIDFYNPKARDWWASNFNYDKYVGSTKNLFTWNDMNEPSVFSGPEITIPKDVIHYGNVEHRNVHNLYGTMFVSSFFIFICFALQRMDSVFIFSTIPFSVAFCHRTRPDAT